MERNLSAHKTQKVKDSLAAHPSVQMHYTPTYSSWLNQVELWFAKIERDVIARGVFTSVKDLPRKLMRYIRLYNRAPKPVKWTYRNVSHRISPESVLPATSADGSNCQSAHAQSVAQNSMQVERRPYPESGIQKKYKRKLVVQLGYPGGLVAAIEKIRNWLRPGSTCVVVLPDRGERYLDTVYSDRWVREHFGQSAVLWPARGPSLLDQWK